jgi:ATP-binding cassette subfamily C (CFTR/MRP) protein 1
MAPTVEQQISEDEQDIMESGVTLPGLSEDKRSESLTDVSDNNSAAKPKLGIWLRKFALRARRSYSIPTERRISKEERASVIGILTFHWISSLMSVGHARPLQPNDIWLISPKRQTKALADQLKEQFKKRVNEKSKRPLLGALYATFKFEFLLGGVCSLVAAVLQVTNSFVLKYLINFASKMFDAKMDSSVAKPNIGEGVGIVLAMAVSQLIQSGCRNQFLYRGMTVGGHARAVLVSLIFDKSLIISSRAKAGGRAQPEPNKGLAEIPANVKPGSLLEREWFVKVLGKQRRFKTSRRWSSKQAHESAVESGWDNGNIVNLMSVDTYRIDQASGLFHLSWTAPATIILTLALLVINIKYSALAGFGILLIIMPLLGLATSSLSARRKIINNLTDQRISLTQEVLVAIRSVKYFVWEKSFLDKIGSLRRREITSIQLLLAIRNGMVSSFA